MKLMYCKRCGDVQSLRFESRTCSCGLSSGYYIDKINAVVNGPCIPLGFENMSFLSSCLNQPKSGDGLRFDAFVIPEQCDTIQVKK